MFVYDPVREATLLFGGAPERGVFLGDTWTWDGDEWRQHRVPGPPARGFPAACFHEERGTLIVHGGRAQDGSTLSDTWEWDGAQWRELEANGLYTSDHHQMVYESHQKRLLAFGGWNGRDVTGGTWAWGGSWQRLSASGPPKRAAFAMAYDRDRQRAVLCGGLWVQGQYADVWEWDGATWSAVGGAYENSSVDHHAMLYDADQERMIVYGGKDYRYQARGETLTLSDNTLTRLAAEGPGPRYSMGMTYDSKHRRILLYGGKRLEDRTQLPIGDLWEWSGQSWNLIAGEQAPGADVQASRVQSPEEQVRAALDTLLEAFRNGNVEVLEQMITSNYVHCNSGAPIIGRDAWLEYNRKRRQQLEDGSLRVDELLTEELAIEILNPETAVVSGVNVNRGVRDGEPYESKVRFTHTWVFQDGRWKRAAFHDTRQ